jgi:aspartyl-tRNA(Asn)/glutamyl-tRNA(Gln) amidotransferase subunit B
MKYEVVIGLEVHAQLLTKSKMYCACSTDYTGAPPNTHVCPICLGLPGVLPVVNKQAVEYAMMTALALHCSIAELTEFARKNYHYPDLMKGYQISQFDTPIGSKGWMMIDVEGQTKKVGITRVHMEEDPAKLLHRNLGGEDYSLIDVNRSGCPLIEIVGEPDLRSAEEARQYLIKLRGILQYLGVSNGNMEEGSFRCDANISLRTAGAKEFGTKVEIKNMNSFKSVYLAIEYEIKRQTKALDEGKKLVQETRGWVEAEVKTVSQRSKEFAHDYRYFPEPDLPPIVIGKDWVDSVKAKLPELPEVRRERFISEYNLTPYDADLLTSSSATADYLEAFVKADKFHNLSNAGVANVGREEPHNLSNAGVAKMGSNWLLGEVNRIKNDNNIDTVDFSKKVSPERLRGLTNLVSSGVISGTVAKTVLDDMFSTGKTADEIIQKSGVSQINDTGELENIVSEVIKSNVQPVADYKAGKEAALKFLVGMVMKASKGRANPQVVNDVLKKKLAETP